MVRRFSVAARRQIAPAEHARPGKAALSSLIQIKGIGQNVLSHTRFAARRRGPCLRSFHRCGTLHPPAQRPDPAPDRPLLGGCDWVVLNPSGDVARQQADLVVISTVLMLLIIVPVMALTVWLPGTIGGQPDRAL